MLSIGEFSKVTSLTVKTIRLYHEKGLLPPAVVSDESGYRYYDAKSVERAHVISELRALEFSLADIAQILESGEDEADIVSLLEKHKDEIARKLDHYQNVHRALETLVSREREAAMTIKNATSIEEKDVEPMLVAGIRGKGIYADAGKRLGKVARSVGRHIAGKPLGLYFDAEYKEQDADFESCFPIDREVQAPGIEVHRIAGGRCVSLVHVGPYGALGESYRRVFEYIHQHKLTPKVPSREIYVKGPGMIFKGNPKKYVTEIQVFVEPKES